MGLIIVVLAAITLVAGGAAPVKADWNKAASDQTLAQVAVASPMMSSRKAPIASPYTYPSQQQLFLPPPPLEVLGADQVDGGALLQTRNNSTGETSEMLISWEMLKEATQDREMGGWLLLIHRDNASIPMFIPYSLERQSPVIRLMIQSVAFKGFNARKFINFFIILSAGVAVIGGSVMGLRIILAYGLGSGYALSQAFQSLLVALVGMGMLMFSEQSVEWLNQLQMDQVVRTFEDADKIWVGYGVWPIINFLIHLGYVITVLGFGWNSLMITLDALFNTSTEPSPVVFQRILAMTIAFLILRFATNIAEFVKLIT